LLNRFGINKIIEHLKPLVEKGLCSVLIFGVPESVEKVFFFF